MATKGLPKVADAEVESQYGYVFGVSGPGKKLVWSDSVYISYVRITILYRLYYGRCYYIIIRLGLFTETLAHILLIV